LNSDYAFGKHPTRCLWPDSLKLI